MFAYVGLPQNLKDLKDLEAVLSNAPLLLSPDRGRIVAQAQHNHLSLSLCRWQDADPRETLRGGIPGAVFEPLVRSWSHFVGIYRQKLTSSLKK